MRFRVKPRNKLVNITTTDLQVTDLSDALWHYAMKVDEVVSGANVSSYARDHLRRTTDRLRHYARDLGTALTQPDPEAFSNQQKTREALLAIRK
jgi:hypothetical protein